MVDESCLDSNLGRLVSGTNRSVQPTMPQVAWSKTFFKRSRRYRRQLNLPFWPKFNYRISLIEFPGFCPFLSSSSAAASIPLAFAKTKQTQKIRDGKKSTKTKKAKKRDRHLQIKFSPLVILTRLLFGRLKVCQI